MPPTRADVINAAPTGLDQVLTNPNRTEGEKMSNSGSRPGGLGRRVLATAAAAAIAFVKIDKFSIVVRQTVG